MRRRRLAPVLLLMLAAPRIAVAGGGFSILSEHARVRIYPDANALRCSDTLLIRRPADANRFSIRLLPIYEIAAFTVDGKEAGPRRRDEFLMVEAGGNDTVVRVEISYAGRFAIRSEFSSLSAGRAVLREEEFLPTLDGDSLHVIGAAALTLVVPASWEAYAVGRLTAELHDGDSAVYAYSCERPIPMIGWICAGVFHTEGGEREAVHCFPEDSARAGGILRLADSVVAYYGAAFLPYRFPFLHIIEVDDWLAGRNVLAVAVPGMVLVKKLAFTTDDRFNTAEAVLPHEIAHQWWPATVFIGDEDAAFLSEGLCEYSARMFALARGAMSARDTLARHPLLRPLLLRAEEGRDLPLRKKADLRSFPTQYLKGSYVHHMLRGIMGEGAFSRLYAEYARRWEGRRATLADFRSLAEELSGRKLGWFFDQWVEGTGIPHLRLYNVHASPEGGGWVTRGRVRMTGYEKFTAVVRVGTVTRDGPVSAVVRVGADSTGAYANDVPFSIRSAARPDSMLLDPLGDLLKIEKLPAKLSDLRDPADGLMVVGTGEGGGRLLACARADSAELDRWGWNIRIAPDTAITLRDLQGGRVILYGAAPSNSVASQLAAKFPIRPDGRSVAAGGERLTDTTLAFVEAVESPYSPRGIFFWVAPMGTSLEGAFLLPLDASWAVVRGREEIASGTWEVRDEELNVRVK